MSGSLCKGAKALQSGVTYKLWAYRYCLYGGLGTQPKDIAKKASLAHSLHYPHATKIILWSLFGTCPGYGFGICLRYAHDSGAGHAYHPSNGDYATFFQCHKAHFFVATSTYGMWGKKKLKN